MANDATKGMAEAVVVSVNSMAMRVKMACKLVGATLQTETTMAWLGACREFTARTEEPEACSSSSPESGKLGGNHEPDSAENACARVFGGRGLVLLGLDWQKHELWQC